MKKLNLVLGMVLFASLAMAQNTANLSQAGGNQNATIGQTGANTANVTQSSDDGMAQRANVSQTGSNTLTITQVELGAATNGYSNPVQTSDVVQDGTANSATISQSETGSGDKYLSSVKLDQFGDGNSSSQTTNAPQSNSGLKVIGVQEGHRNTLVQNITSGYTEYFKATQIGNDNVATQIGSGSTADGTILQDGSSNTASQTLSGMNNGYYRTGMLIKQIGDGNSASQTFWGSGYNAGHSGETYQYGNNNTATQTGSGHHFTSIVTQEGSSNTATVNQEGTASPLLYDNSVELTQDGDGNTATIKQNLGSSNTIKLLQSGGGTATLEQSGNQNVVKGLNSSWAQFNGSSLNVAQTGNLNSLSIEADGVVGITQNNAGVASAQGNEIEFSQVGGGASILSQTGGDANLIKLTKTGGGDANIAQTGNTNKVAMFDDVFGTADVTGAALFNGANLDISQTGEGNLLHLNSTSADAMVNVMQNGMNNQASIVQQ